MSTLQWALHYSGLGYAVLPVEPGGKLPLARLVPNGLKNASSDEETIFEWFSERKANIAIVPPAGVLVLDVEKIETASRLINDYGLQRAPVALTRGGGLHIWLSVPENCGLKAKVKALPDVDLRGLGRSYVLVAPSRVAPGEYRWGTELKGPSELPPCPERLLKRLQPVERSVVSPSSGPAPKGVSRNYALGELQGRASDMAGTGEGARNSSLVRHAFALGGWVGSGALSPEEVSEALLGAALAAGLEAGEARATIASGLRAGVLAPRTAPPAPRQDFSDRRGAYFDTWE